MSEANPYRAFKTLTDLSEIELKYANILTRMVSFLADIAFALVLSVPLVIRAMDYFVMKAQQGQILLPFYHYLFAPIALTIVFFVWVICALFEASGLRGTPGKLLAGNEVVSGLGEQIDLKNAFTRQIVKFNFVLLIVFFPFVDIHIFTKLIVYVSLPITAINILLVVFHVDRQAFHDIASKTYVVHADKRSFFRPLILFPVAVLMGYSVLTWIKDNVVNEALSNIPQGAKESLFNTIIKGERNVIVQVGGENLVPASKAAPKSIQVSSAQAYEFIDDSIYKDALTKSIEKVVVINNPEQALLNIRKPAHMTMEYSGSYVYEFKTYIPKVPNLVVNPAAFSLIIDAAYDRIGSKLTPQVNDETLIEERVVEDQNYILVKKKVYFAQAAPVEKINGSVNLRLPINLKSEAFMVDNPAKEIKIGAQTFLITSVNDKSIEFVHDGSAEYFLGVVAYEKGSSAPLIGNMKVTRDQPMRAVYSYEFDRSIAKYEFNTALYFYLESFPFSNIAQQNSGS
jgi:uncharacterized RDD family membrane protein YckC